MKPYVYLKTLVGTTSLALLFTLLPGAAECGGGFQLQQVDPATSNQLTCIVNVDSPFDTVLEAEDQQLFGDPLVANDHPGYTGTGFVDFQDDFEESVFFWVNLPESGNYFLKFRYALDGGNRPLDVLFAGGEFRHLPFPDTGGWTNWKTVGFCAQFEAGANAILVVLPYRGNSGPNLDHLRVSSEPKEKHLVPNGQILDDPLVPFDHDLRSFRRGDATADGKVDLSDATKVLGFTFVGDDQPLCLDAADANDDDLVDLSDATTVMSYLFLGGSPLPEQCVFDLTSSLGCSDYNPCE